MTSPQGTTWNSRRGHCSSAVFPAKTQRRPTHPPPECPAGGEGTDPQLGQNPKQTLQLKEPMGAHCDLGHSQLRAHKTGA